MRTRSRPAGMHRHAILALLIAVVVAACGGDPDPTPTAKPIDPQGSWQLVSGTDGGSDIPIVEDHPITLTIEGSRVGGTSACNSYGGRLEAQGGRLRITDLGMTAMGCEEPVMASETAYTGALGRVDAITMDGAALVLGGPDVELRFEALPPPPTGELVDTVWVLDTLISGGVAAAPAGERATLELRSDGTLSGSTGCRTFTGTWVETGEQITTPNLAMGEMACPPELGAQDSHVIAVIGDGFVPSLDGPRLTLADRGGDSLVYVAEHEE